MATTLSDEIARLLSELDDELAGIPEEDQLTYIKRKLRHLPVAEQVNIIAAWKLGRNARMERIEKTRSAERRLAFTWGIAFLLLLVLLSLFVPNPTPWQYTLYRILLAVAAAGFANYIEGMLGVKAKWIRAGGPLAVFFVVYYVSPAILPSMKP